MSENLLEAQATLRMARPAPEVFEAILDPTEMSHYFISSGSARLATGRTVRWEFENFDIDGHEVEGPFVNGDQFAVRYHFETTNKKTRQHARLSEIAVYTVKDGKIAQERFFDQVTER